MECSERSENNDEKIHVCRVCLYHDSENLDKVLSLFEKYDSILLCDKINYIVNIDIREDDGLPDKICLACVQSLESAYKFKRKCEDSNNILRSAITSEAQRDSAKEIKYETGFEYAETYSPGGNQCVDIKQEYEFTELSDGPINENDTPELSEKATPTNKTFKTRDLQLECHDCGAFFKSKCKLRVHWKREHMAAQLVCPNCKKVYKSYKCLHAHIKRKTKQCLFSSKIKIHGIGRSRIYHCTKCEYNSKRVQCVMNHWVLHSGERRYSCEFCGKSFTQLSSLSVHQENIHKTRIKEGTCQSCGKHIVGRANLYRHMKSHMDLQFPCQVCNKVLKSKPILKQHMIRHSGVKDFICNICAKTFFTSSDLSTHKEKAHFKSKFYKCNLCEYGSRNHSSVARHKKRHTDKNVACDICGIFADNMQQLKLHKLRHTKNVECSYCHKLFYRKKNLQKHLRSIHYVKNVQIIKQTFTADSEAK